MTKKTVARVAGLGALTIASIFAGRASSKFAGAQNLFVSTVGGGCQQIASSPVSKFSTIGTNQATISTNANSANKLKVWQDACNTTSGKRVYFKP